MSIIRGRVIHDEWTEYEDGRPVRGVGYRGYWNNEITVGGSSPFRQCECGEWVLKDTGEHGIVKSITLEKMLELNNIDIKYSKEENKNEN